ncbi:MAG TPA: WYL domain-containing protein [Candidatus Dormibacteraeota bacterium]|nr:WYL domain-containing protein [Candidatus Dormibacteraeota bacterium]
MRADRVLALLLLLQARGRLSAAELAARLEVSRRTVYRDVDALGAAGVPVRTEPGPHGGIELVEGWRTDLTGLTESELDALFTTAAGPAFESAMGKLAAALPGESGRRAGRMRERLLVDSAGWGRRGAASPHLRVVQDAVFADRRLRLRYRRAEAQVTERVVDPLGLVLKAGVWYLVADVDGKRRLFRLSRVEAAEALDDPARRPRGFDLAAAWREQAARWDAGQMALQVSVKVADADLPLVLRVAGDRVTSRPTQGVVRMAFPAIEPAAAFLSSFGGLVEALEPLQLRVELARRGADMVRLYSPAEKPRRRDESRPLSRPAR